MLNTQKKIKEWWSRNQGQWLKPWTSISASERIVLGISKKHSLAKFHNLIWFLFATVCVSFKRKLWVICEHHIVISYRQNWLQKARVEPVSGVSCGTQQGQRTWPLCRSGNVSHRGSDYAYAPGLAQVWGKACATAKAWYISIPVASPLISHRGPACDFYARTLEITDLLHSKTWCWGSRCYLQNFSAEIGLILRWSSSLCMKKMTPFNEKKILCLPKGWFNRVPSGLSFWRVLYGSSWYLGQRGSFQEWPPGPALWRSPWGTDISDGTGNCPW